MITSQILEEETVANTVLSPEKTLSVVDLIINGGAASVVIILVLFALLFLAVYIYVERTFALKAASHIDNHFTDQIRNYILKKQFEAARKLCAQTNSPVARLTEKGIARIGKSPDDINTAIENAGTLEVYKLEKNVSLLATIAAVAPMLGFLGTVIGMILAFHTMASHGGQAEMGALASGIYTAMTTTAAGLIVGIIAYIGYNHLVYKTNQVIHDMETHAVEFLEMLNEPI